MVPLLKEPCTQSLSVTTSQPTAQLARGLCSEASPGDFFSEIFTGEPSPVFSPLVTSAPKDLNPPLLKMYSDSKTRRRMKLYASSPCFQGFIPFYFKQVTKAPFVSNFCLRSQLGQLSTTYLHPSVISTGI